METIKCLNVDDVFLMKLPGGTYKVDGEIVTAPYGGLEIQCESDVIVKVSQNNITSHYENGEGEKMSVEEHDKTLAELKSKGEDDGDYGYTFENPDDNYAYYTFVKSWVRCLRDVIGYSDPLPIEKKPLTCDTGNEFITPIISFSVNGGVYQYNRSGACMKAAQDTFKELGMTFGGKLDYGETKKDKVWGNSDHSHMRYITAFGTYLFSEKYSTGTADKGDLARMTARYNADTKFIRTRIRSMYAAHFNGASIDIKEYRNKLSAIKSMVSKIDPKKKSWGDYSSAINLINRTIADVDAELEKKAD